MTAGWFACLATIVRCYIYYRFIAKSIFRLGKIDVSEKAKFRNKKLKIYKIYKICIKNEKPHMRKLRNIYSITILYIFISIIV